MSEIEKAVDSIANFRECLTDPHDFDQDVARLRAAVADSVPRDQHERVMKWRDDFGAEIRAKCVEIDRLRIVLGGVAALLAEPTQIATEEDGWVSVVEIDDLRAALDGRSSEVIS